ncbi:MAG TPA: TetR/AcrR family transcriptional regulator [Dermatophilaceae bacterium]|nr:TetR/AcrR family transcriptional regulator [Dermatophilaceae bacterium]
MPRTDGEGPDVATPRRGRPGYDLPTLLEATVEVFNKKGFDGTSMEDLSRRLGISKSAIYHHVASKDELLDLAVSRALDGLGDAMAHSRDLEGSAVARLEHLIRASVHVLVERKPFVTLLLRVRGNTEVERRALQRRRTFDQYCAKLVMEAAADGAVRPDIDPAVTARLLFGMVNSLIEWARPQTDQDVELLADAVWALAFDGMRDRG